MIKEKIKEYQYKKYIEEHKENIKKAFVELSTCPLANNRRFKL